MASTFVERSVRVPICVFPAMFLAFLGGRVKGITPTDDAEEVRGSGSSEAMSVVDSTLGVLECHPGGGIDGASRLNTGCSV